MSDEKKPDEVLEPKAPKPQAPQTPQQLLASIQGAPAPAQIDAWKAEVPNHRIRLFAPDLKRVYVIRGISGLEVAQIQKSIPMNSEERDIDFQLIACEKAVLWTNASYTHKLTAAELKAGTAGLPGSIFEIVSDLSDYFPPDRIALMSGDL